MYVTIAECVSKYFAASSGCQQLTAYIAAVPDQALTASSEVHSTDGGNFGAENSRLFARSNFPNVGGWMASFDAVTTSQYIQVRTVTKHTYTKIYVMVGVTWMFQSHHFVLNISAV